VEQWFLDVIGYNDAANDDESKENSTSLCCCRSGTWDHLKNAALGQRLPIQAPEVAVQLELIHERCEFEERRQSEELSSGHKSHQTLRWRGRH